MSKEHNQINDCDQTIADVTTSTSKSIIPPHRKTTLVESPLDTDETTTEAAPESFPQYEIHPIAEIFPPLEKSDLDELAKDIVENGLKNPIVLHENQILDGRNRYQACEPAGVAPQFVEWNGTGSPLSFAVSQNLHRRHLSTSQRAAIAADLISQFEQEAKQRQREHGHTAPGKNHLETIVPECSDGKSTEKAGKLLNVSGKSVARAKQLKTIAPELHAEVKAGKQTLNAALKEALPSKKVGAKTAKQSHKDDSFDPNQIMADFHEWSHGREQGSYTEYVSDLTESQVIAFKAVLQPLACLWSALKDRLTLTNQEPQPLAAWTLHQ